MQNVFEQSTQLRTISLNTHYIVAFKNHRNQRQMYTLIRQVVPRNPEWLIQAYEDAVKKPYSYMVFDARSDSHDSLRFRSEIFDRVHGPFFYRPCSARKSI